MSIVLSILSSSIRFVAFDKELYKREFKKNYVYDKVKDVDERASNLFGYLSGKEQLDKRFFNSKEIRHMEDVKKLLSVAFLLFCVSSSLFVALLCVSIATKDFKVFSDGLVYGSIASFVLLVLLFLLSLNFDTFFVYFHKLFFRNNLWLMDPQKDTLVLMFPEAFFRTATTRLFFIATLLSASVGATGVMIKMLRRAHVCP